jgi:hypothetical protein
MNEQMGTAGGTGRYEPADTVGGTPLEAAQAADILREAGQRARRQLRVRHRAAFAFWGLVLLLGYGALWLAARGQRPFHGPDPAAFAVVALLGNASVMAGGAEARASNGIGGLSAVRRRVHFLVVLAGLAALFALEGALVRVGADRAVTGVFEASAPILVAGLFYLTASAVRLDWPLLGLGLWLVVVAAVGGFAGSAGVWGVDALAAGLAFLVMAVLDPWLRPA